MTFTSFFKNSFILSGVGTLGAVISSAFVAFGFARLRFVGKNFWFTCMLLTLMLPAQVQIIPQYIIFNKLNWINTFRPLLIPRFFGQAFFIFLMIQFIQGIPRELDEAAEIDGAGKLGIFFRIILPLLTPALITSTIFSFYWTWEDFFGPLLYLSDPKNVSGVAGAEELRRCYRCDELGRDLRHVGAVVDPGVCAVHRVPALHCRGDQHDRTEGLSTQERSTSACQSARVMP